MKTAHDPVQNFIDALYESDKEGRYLPLFSTKCEEYRYKGLCGEDCPVYGSKEECKIDAVPVVRGKWTTNSDYPDTVICSLCGYKEDMWWADKGTNYCPNCGAKMEVE